MPLAVSLVLAESASPSLPARPAASFAAAKSRVALSRKRNYFRYVLPFWVVLRIEPIRQDIEGGHNL
ncbi:MAG: hypothetical protein H5U01_11885 [Clostridia bacterium]|nr:hypothetical protein [Clostridia bacterium]